MSVSIAAAKKLQHGSYGRNAIPWTHDALCRRPRQLQQPQRRSGSRATVQHDLHRSSTMDWCEKLRCLDEVWTFTEAQGQGRCFECVVSVLAYGAFSTTEKADPGTGQSPIAAEEPVAVYVTLLQASSRSSCCLPIHAAALLDPNDQYCCEKLGFRG